MPVDIAYAIFLAKSFALAYIAYRVTIAALAWQHARERRRRKAEEGR
jgi:hypothetical protein